MKIALYTQDGSVSGEIEISSKVFGHAPNPALVHKILILQHTNMRNPVAHVKTKGEVRGTGKKPYKQKGTGWARQGSLRNPHFVGGGVAHGPRNDRSFNLRAPRKERQKALFCALSDKAQSGSIAALEQFQRSGERPKTKEFVLLLKKLPFEKTVLFITKEQTPDLFVSSRNISRVKTITMNQINIHDILKFNAIIFLKDALHALEEQYAGK